MQGILKARRLWLLTTAALLCVTVAGCGKKPTPVDVTGKVVFEVSRPKSPLAISLHPLEDVNKTCTPSGLLDEAGGFKLKQCLPGRYKATIIAPPIQLGGGAGAGPGDVGATPGGPTTPGLPKAYFDAQSSPWEVMVPEGGKDGLVLTLSPR